MKLEENFPKISIYCYEEYVKENYKKIKVDEFDLVSNLLNLSLKEIDLAFEFYKKYYFHPIIFGSKKEDVSKKESYFILQFLQKNFQNFSPDIILHEHTGGTGSKILWNFCKNIIVIIIL